MCQKNQLKQKIFIKVNYLKKIDRYLNTIKYLKPKQIFFRIFYYFYKKPFFIPHKSININSEFRLKRFETKTNSILQDRKIKVFNNTYNLFVENFWNQKINKLELYELHYFDYLNSKDISISESKELIRKWIEDNQSFKGVGWESYTVSLRLVNWIKFLVNNNISDKNISNSILQQALYLKNKKEYHLLGNHLFANLKALIFAFKYMSFKGSNKILKYTIIELKQEIDGQILDDGTHIEQSPMYHNLFLFDLLDLYNLFSSSESSNEISLIYLEEKILDLLKVSDLLRHPDGKVPCFNDSAIENSLNFEELLNYSSNLGIKYNSASKSTNILKKGGFATMKKSNKFLIFKIGNIACNYQPGHTHADIASFELSLDGERFFLNTGISTYEEGQIRDYQRSSFSKNTLTVDRKNSSDIWKSFRVGQRISKANFESIKDDEFRLSYDGFKNFIHSINHKRAISLTNQYLEIKDEVDSAIKNVEINLHLSGDAVIHTIDSNYLRIKFKDKFYDLKSEGNIELRTGEYGIGFNMIRRNHKASIKMNSNKHTLRLLFK